MRSQNYTSHILSMSVLVTLGNAIVIMRNLNLVNISLSLILSLIIVWAMSFLLKFGQKNKAVYFCTALVVCVAAIYSATAAFLDYITFLKAEQMPQTSIWLIGSGFAAIIAFFVISKTTAIYKYSLFVFVLITGIIVLCFAGGIKSFDYKNLNSNFLDTSFSTKNFFRFFVSVLVLSFFVKEDKKDTKPIFLGVLIGFLLLLIVMLHIIFTLGTTEYILYPYLKSVSVISSGSLFTRLDGLVWFLFFATALIKSVVCIKTVKKCITQN